MDAARLHTAHRILSYDRLVFACGTRPRRLPDLQEPAGTGRSEPSQLDNVACLRGFCDAEHILGLLPEAQHVTVVGGGFIGLELAATLRELGKTVTIVEAGSRLMARSVSPKLSAWFADLHRAQGVDLRLNRRIVEVERTGRRISALRLDDGSTLATELVVVGIGVLPNDQLAKASEICPGSE